MSYKYDYIIEDEDLEIVRVGQISNFYGGLYVMIFESKYYWLIKSYNTNFRRLSNWEEIDKELYNNLIKRIYVPPIED